MTALVLTPVQRQSLKGIAHSLDPVVLIGDAGLTPAVLKEIDRSLTAHELIKVRVAGDDREARIAIYGRICDELGAAPVQHIGKLLVLFRPAAQRVVPAAKPAARGTRSTTERSARPRSPLAPAKRSPLAPAKRSPLAPAKRSSPAPAKRAAPARRVDDDAFEAPARPARAARPAAGAGARPDTARVNPVSGRVAKPRAPAKGTDPAAPRARPNRAQRIRASGQKSSKKGFQDR